MGRWPTRPVFLFMPLLLVMGCKTVRITVAVQHVETARILFTSVVSATVGAMIKTQMNTPGTVLPMGE